MQSLYGVLGGNNLPNLEMVVCGLAFGAVFAFTFVSTLFSYSLAIQSQNL
jgi:hypothetical protein